MPINQVNESLSPKEMNLDDTEVEGVARILVNFYNLNCLSRLLLVFGGRRSILGQKFITSFLGFVYVLFGGQKGTSRAYV